MSAEPIRYLPRQAGTSVSVRIVNGAMRASVGSTEAGSDKSASVSSDRRAQRDLATMLNRIGLLLADTAAREDDLRRKEAAEMLRRT